MRIYNTFTQCMYANFIEEQIFFGRKQFFYWHKTGTFFETLRNKFLFEKLSLLKLVFPQGHIIKLSFNIAFTTSSFANLLCSLMERTFDKKEQ